MLKYQKTCFYYKSLIVIFISLQYFILILNFFYNILYGSLEIDNNGSERAIKSFVIGRKNWMFSSSSKGAKASALIYSIIETAKANNLVVEKYLVYMFDRLSKEGIKSRDEILDMMPLSAALPEEVKISNSKKN